MTRLFRKKPAVVLILLLIIAYTQNLSASGKERVAVLSFLPLKSDAGYTRIIRDSLEMALYRQNSFTLLERDQIQRSFRARNLEPHNCRSRKCIQSMGTMLSARFVITGTLEKNRRHTLKAQVHRMPSGRVLFSYIKIFSGEEKRKEALNQLAARITRDILQYGDMPIITPGEKKPPLLPPNKTHVKRSPLPISIGVEGLMILPAGHFHSLVHNGYGVHAAAEVTPLRNSSHYLLRHLFFGLKSGYQSYTGRVNSKDRATLVPVLGMAGLLLPLPSIFSLRFSIGGGITQVTLSHGTGDGFDMPDNSSVRSTEATMEFFAGPGIRVFKGLNIYAGWFYAMRIEESLPVHTTGFTVAAAINFQI